ncbi:MAG: hypothetical protein ABSG78_14320 [Verrucomicrobiota bacterium]|jgi:hypothetical protein
MTGQPNTRRQRADRVKRQQTAFFNHHAPEAREIPDLLLEKYAADVWRVARPAAAATVFGAGGII